MYFKMKMELSLMGFCILLLFHTVPVQGLITTDASTAAWIAAEKAVLLAGTCEPSSKSQAELEKDFSGFSLFRSKEEYIGKEINSLESIKASGFKTGDDCTTTLLIHGFGQSLFCEFFQIIKDALHVKAEKEKKCINVIGVDWNKLSGYCLPSSQNLTETVCTATIEEKYCEAVYNTEVVGKFVAKFLALLVNNSFVLKKNIEMIGFSLGSHVAGYAGRYFATIYDQKVHKITGLDPAGPCYYSGEIGESLGEGDADSVICYHSNRGGLGIDENNCDCDININGGRTQSTSIPSTLGTSTTLLNSPDLLKTTISAFGSKTGIINDHIVCPRAYAQLLTLTDNVLRMQCPTSLAARSTTGLGCQANNSITTDTELNPKYRNSFNYITTRDVAPEKTFECF